MILVRFLDLKFLNGLAARTDRNFKSTALAPCREPTVVTCAYAVGRRWWAKVDVECAGAFPFDAGPGRVLFRAMKAVASRPVVTARPLALPNLLTYARIAAVPLVVACLYWQDILQGGLWLRWVALAIFIAAGVTDVLDGYFARKWGE